MSELRQDMISKEWVIIATERARRPDHFRQAASSRPPLPARRADCPFCPGNEAMSTPPLLTLPGGGAETVRVVPNKFAALRPVEDCCHVWTGKFLRVGGYGSAEVVIETPRHDLSPAIMSPQQVALILDAYRERYIQLAEDDRHHLITIFRNHGERAGTSLEHPHSQIIAAPVVPPHVRNQIIETLRAFDTYSTCLFCVMVEEERNERSRIILETEHFVAFCPFASRSPFEMRIFPRRHSCSFNQILPGERDDLAALLRTVLGKLHRGLNDPDYNLIIRSHPLTSRANRHYHWYIMIIPKLSTPAGFEIGTGIYINSAAPEECAAFLRDVEPAEIVS